MNKLTRKLRTAVAVATAVAAPLLTSGTASGGRPLTIDDAGPVPHTVWQLEAGTAYLKRGSTDHWDIPVGLTYGLAPRLAVGVGFGAQYEDRVEAFEQRVSISDVRDLTVSAKWQVADERDAWASVAVAPTLKIPVADDDKGMGTGHFDYELALLATKTFGATAVDANVAFVLRTDDGDGSIPDVLRYGVAVRQTVSPDLTLVGEVFALTQVPNGLPSVATSAGVQYRVGGPWVLDAAVGFGLDDRSPEVVAKVGFTVRF